MNNQTGETNFSQNEGVIQMPDNKSFYHSGKLYDLYEAGTPYFLAQQQDIAFWQSMAMKYGNPVLELACGTGRVSISLAKQGFQVTGIDISELMLERAREKSSLEKVREDFSLVKWIKCDIRNFDINQKFPLIIFPYNGLRYLLELEEIESCLNCVKKHLDIGGKFVVDVKNPSLKYFNDFSLSHHRDVDSIFQDPDGKGTIVVTRTRVYDAEQQLLTRKMFFRFPGYTEDVVEELKFRCYFPKELEALFKYNGFIIENKFGNYDGTVFTSESPQQIIVCSLMRQC